MNFLETFMSLIKKLNYLANQRNATNVDAMAPEFNELLISFCKENQVSLTPEFLSNDSMKSI